MPTSSQQENKGDKMTLIAAIVDQEKNVHMIGDRLATNESGDIFTLAFAKVGILTTSHGQDKVIIGASGNVEMSIACTQLFTPLPLPEDKSDLALYQWSLKEMRPKLREMFVQSDLLKKDKDGEPELPGLILIAARGRILRFERKVVPLMIQRSYWAIGSGDDCCMGVMNFALRSLGNNLPTAVQCKEYLISSMRVVVELKTSVGPPFDYINTKGERETIEK